MADHAVYLVPESQMNAMAGCVMLIAYRVQLQTGPDVWCVQLIIPHLLGIDEVIAQAGDVQGPIPASSDAPPF